MSLITITLLLSIYLGYGRHGNGSRTVYIFMYNTVLPDKTFEPDLKVGWLLHQLFMYRLNKK